MNEVVMVVRIDDIGELKVLCFTLGGEPCVYRDADAADQCLQQLRAKHPHYTFDVLTAQVL